MALTHFLQVLNIFQIERIGEAKKLEKCNSRITFSRRYLLWHGSPVSNYASILRHGLRIGPTRGIFFADQARKSIGFCRAQSGEDAFVLLCEVELGRQSAWKSHGVGVEQTCDSYIVKGQTHKVWHDAGCVHPDLKGVKIPDVSSNQIPQRPAKEYVILNRAQIRQRYIFHIKID